MIVINTAQFKVNHYFLDTLLNFVRNQKIIFSNEPKELYLLTDKHITIPVFQYIMSQISGEEIEKYLILETWMKKASGKINMIQLEGLLECPDCKKLRKYFLKVKSNHEEFKVFSRHDTFDFSEYKKMTDTPEQFTLIITHERPTECSCLEFKDAETQNKCLLEHLMIYIKLTDDDVKEFREINIEEESNSRARILNLH